MPKYDIVLQKMPLRNVDACTSVLAKFGKSGYDVKFVTMQDAFLYVIFSKELAEKKGPGRPPKKKAE